MTGAGLGSSETTATAGTLGSGRKLGDVSNAKGVDDDAQPHEGRGRRGVGRVHGAVGHYAGCGDRYDRRRRHLGQRQVDRAQYGSGRPLIRLNAVALSCAGVSVSIKQQEQPMTKTKRVLRRLQSDEGGAALVEYTV